MVGYQFFHSDPDVAMVRVDDDIVRPGARSNFHGPANSWTALHQEADPDFVRLADVSAQSDSDVMVWSAAGLPPACRSTPIPA